MSFNNLKMLEEQINQHYKHFEIETDKLYLVNLSDIHVGSKGFDEKTFKKTIDVLSQIKNVMVILGGDSINHANKGSKSSQFEETMTPREQVLHLEKLIQPIKNKIICKISGNHDATRSKEFNDFSLMEWFCDRNRIPFFDEYALLQFSIGDCAFTSFVMHKTGATGKNLNVGKLQQFGEMWRCDIIFGEHSHKRHYGSEVYTDIDLRNRKAIVREQWYINTNSFLNWSGYAVENGYRISKTGCNVVELTGGRCTKRNIRVIDLETLARIEGVL